MTDKIKFDIHTNVEYQSGYESASLEYTSSTCSEMVSIEYDCNVLPWENKDSYSPIGTSGYFGIRDCGVYDSCVNEGILSISNDYRTTPPDPPTFVIRGEERLLYESKSVIKFRMRQWITEKIPRPGGEEFYPFAYVIALDGEKTLMVVFGEMIDGTKLIMIPTEAIIQGDDFIITKLIATYYPWTNWSEYRFTRDKGGDVSLYADDGIYPILSYPYSGISFPSMADGGYILFGNAGRHYTSGVSEWDYFDYSIGENSIGGCASDNGRFVIDSIFSRSRLTNLGYDLSEIFLRGRVDNVEGIGSNTQSHKFYLRMSREVRDTEGRTINRVVSQDEIGPLGTGRNPSYIVVEGVNKWDGKSVSGEYVNEGVYRYKMNVSVVRVDKKGKEKEIASVMVSGNTYLVIRIPPKRVIRDLPATAFGMFFDYYTYSDSIKKIPYAYYLKDCSTGSDPILDILYEYNPSAPMKYMKVSSNDDYNICNCEERPHQWPPLICKCEVGSSVGIMPSGETWVLGIIRAKDYYKAGSCRVERCRRDECITLSYGLSFGGVAIQWGWSRGDGIQSVFVEKEREQDTVMLLSEVAQYGSDSYKMLMIGSPSIPAIDDDSGTGKASFIPIDMDKESGITYIGKKPFIKGTYRVNVYRNDSLYDRDGDRLGQELERELMLCDNKTDRFGDFYCSSVYNTRDTDGDGIEDYVEVFGCDRGCRSGNNIYPGCYGAEYPVSACGSGRVLYKNTDSPQYLPAWGADPRRKDIFYEVDKELKLDSSKYPTIVELLKIYNKYKDEDSTIINPDGNKGIRIHFDVGDLVKGCENYPYICGSWGDGGENVKSGDSYFGYQCCFKPIRKGLFRYALATTGGGGQSPGNYIDRFGFGCENKYRGWPQFTHESGHNGGLEHYGHDLSGKYNYKPHYTSLMSYAYSYNFDGSVENIHFSNGRYSNIVLNPIKVCESEGLGTGNRLTFLEKDCFGYKVDDNGGVDWNRDGVISSCNNDPECSNPDNCVSAYINYCSGNPDALRYRQNTNWNNGEKSMYAPKLVVFNSELYIFYVKLEDGNLYYSRFIGFENCDPDGYNPCDKWSQPQIVPVNHTPVSGPAASEIKIGSEKRLYIAFISDDGNIYSRYINDRGIWSNEDIVIASGAIYEPELKLYRNSLILVFVNTNNKLVFKLMNENGEWQQEKSVRDEYGNEIHSYISPSVAVKPYFVYRWPFVYDLSIAHIIYSSDNYGYILSMRYYEEDEDRWYRGVNFGGGDINVDIWEHIQRSNKKVGFEWVNDRGIVEKGGRFYIMFKNIYLDDKGNFVDDKVVKYGFMMPDNYGRWKWMKIGDQDNDWTLAITGVSLVPFSGSELTGLSSVYVQPENTIKFIPYANGIYDYELRDSDDWQILSNGFCISIRRVFGDDLAYCGPKRNKLYLYFYPEY